MQKSKEQIKEEQRQRGQNLANVLFKHGHSKGGHSSEYIAWVNMRSRCYKVDSKNYSRYGGRGIIVCNRWLGEDGFVNFIKDMGNKPTPKHSLERKNRDGNYEPNNCTWATKLVQSNNTSTNVYITFRSETKTPAQWEREIGIKSGTIRKRLSMGWAVGDALSLPANNVKIKSILKKRAAFISHSFGYLN